MSGLRNRLNGAEEGGEIVCVLSSELAASFEAFLVGCSSDDVDCDGQPAEKMSFAGRWMR
jgi:hypothetical protein